MKYELMKAPAMSGALSYQALCAAAKKEENHGATKRQYRAGSTTKQVPPGTEGGSIPGDHIRVGTPT